MNDILAGLFKYLVHRVAAMSVSHTIHSNNIWVWQKSRLKMGDRYHDIYLSNTRFTIYLYCFCEVQCSHYTCTHYCHADPEFLSLVDEAIRNMSGKRFVPRSAV